MSVIRRFPLKRAFLIAFAMFLVSAFAFSQQPTPPPSGDQQQGGARRGPWNEGGGRGMGMMGGAGAAGKVTAVGSNSITLDSAGKSTTVSVDSDTRIFSQDRQP